ncbi:MAG: nucleotidyltransferase domain-containing protein [archaeon]|nr:nucleotidyltransferase domain-containing protein [archaeon]
MLSKEVVEKIKEELTAFVGAELASIVLYGSYAEGRESKYSDIDILVVVRRHFKDWRARREGEIALRKILYRSVGQVSPRIIGADVILTTLKNFNPLLLNILKHGIPLLDDGTFAKVKEEFQRMVEAKIIEPREDYWMVAIT